METTPKKNRAGLTILVLIITGCLLLSAGIGVVGYFILKSTRDYKPPVVTPAATATLGTIVEPPGETVTPGGMATPAPNTQGRGVPPSIAGQMDLIQEQVLSYRGLPLKNDLMRDMMSDAELKDVVVNEFFVDYTEEDAKNDVIELNVLGLLPADFDLHQFYLDLYSEQIAGYYDSETKEMYVIGGEFKGTERMTYSHEFTHVLQDQNYNLETLLSEEKCDADSEYCSAVTALVEGDAVLSEQVWFLANGTDQDRDEITAFYDSYQSPVYDSAPEYMKQDFLFPYTQGFDFVYSLFSKGKWKAVDAAYTTLPVSTEQILHPQKYPAETPVKLQLQDMAGQLGPGWSEYDHNSMGEWYTYLILSSGYDASFRLADDVAKKASAGWDGDTYMFLLNDNSSDSAFAWLSTWDSRTDSNEFFAASQDYGTKRWGTPQQSTSTLSTWQSDTYGTITMIQNGKYVLWAIGQDEKVMDSLTPLINYGGN